MRFRPSYESELVMVLAVTTFPCAICGLLARWVRSLVKMAFVFKYAGVEGCRCLSPRMTRDHTLCIVISATTESVGKKTPPGRGTLKPV